MKSLLNACRAVFLLCVAATAVAQLPAQTPVIDKPQIEKIDPPRWWTEMPDPMLLVHGDGLDHAQFTVEGKDVSLIKTQASANGHWAFLWLRTQSAVAQTLQITATNNKGQARQAFVLAERSHNPSAHSGFSSSDVLYLIMTDRFADGDPGNDAPNNQRSLPRGWHGGDFAGIEQHLDYLKSLGVTAVWTTPVVSNGAMPQSYHGYAATDLYTTDAHFGTLQQYRQLSDALHAKGMKLVIDLVPNHLGVQHPWVHDPPAPEWFHGTLQDHHRAQYDFYNLVDPHAPREAWRDITNGWFTDAMPDLNQENPLVSRYLIQNALWWVETADLDGIRLDTFPYVSRAFWHDFHAALHEAYPHLTTVGEVFHRDAEVTSFFAGGVEHRGIDTGLDTPFDFPVYFTIRDVLARGKPMTELSDVLRQDGLYPHPERLVTFIGNHDTTRFLTDAGKVGGTDGIVSPIPRLKLALGLIATLRGMPQIYSGDEIGMSGGEDPDNRHDFPGGFVPDSLVDSHNAFTASGRSATEQEVFAWTSGLLAFRSAHRALQTGLEQNLFADDDTFAFVRATSESGCSKDLSEERILIVVNKADRAKPIDLPLEETALGGCTQFHAESPAVGNTPVIDGGKLHIQEPAESMTIYTVR
jgi:glycosidase